MALPLCSVITPTWRRHDLLLDRCIPGVQAQDYPSVEHIVVSDGPDPELREKLGKPGMYPGRHNLWYFELPEHDGIPHWGHLARLHGIEYASGDLIAYCDDDDALYPEHCRLLAAALDAHPEAGWASSMMASHGPGGITEIGAGSPSCGNLGTPMIMHRREILEHGTWGPASSLEDWELVNRWIHAGIGHVKVSEITSDVWPSTFR